MSRFDPGEEQIEYLAHEVVAPLSARGRHTPTQPGQNAACQALLTPWAWLLIMGPMRSLTASTRKEHHMKIRLLTLLVASALVLSRANFAGAATQTLYSWGQYEMSATPLVVTGVPGTVTNLYGINSAGYALTASGQVWAWGNNASGQLGNGTESNTDTVAAVQVQFPPGVVIAKLASGGPRDTEIAIDTNGNAWGMGPERLRPALSARRADHAGQAPVDRRDPGCRCRHMPPTTPAGRSTSAASTNMDSWELATFTMRQHPRLLWGFRTLR